MATTYTPINVNNGFQSATTINANLLDIQQDLDRKLSRFGDENAQLGDLDNSMQANFDMNTYRGLNCPYPEDDPAWNYDLVPKIYIDTIINNMIDLDKIGIATTTLLGISYLATDAEAILATDNSKNLVPSNLPPALNALVPDIIIDQIQNNVNIINEILAVFPPATETVQGKIEIATQAETNTGTDDERAVTPLKLATYVAANATPDATETVKGKAEIATQVETDAGADDTRFITPLKLKNWSGSGTIVDAVLGATGYVQWSNGFMEQWTTMTFVGEDTSANWVFPKAFTSACYGINFSHKEPTGGGLQSQLDFAQERETSHTTTQTTIYMNDFGDGGATLFVRAVGV